MYWVLAIIVAVFSASYFGVKSVLGPPLAPVICNFNVQSFDLRGRTVYWQVQEGECARSDTNFEIVRANIEEMLKERSEWPESECFYEHNQQRGFVFKFGSDYYDVEALDCLEPLRELQREKEENLDLMEFFRDHMIPVKGNTLFDPSKLLNFLI